MRCAEAAAADWAVIYYAGHGVEMSSINYLIPVDAKRPTMSRMRR